MNRLHSWSPETQLSAKSSSQVEQSLLKIGQRGGRPYTLFSPLHYEPNYAYPLVVWLHGTGDDERQLQRIMPLISMRNYVAVAPRGPSVVDGPEPGYGWPQDHAAFAAAEQAVVEGIDAAREKFHIDPDRVFLAGFQCGGTMAFRIGMRDPQRFAGLLSLGGPFPQDGTPLLRLLDARHLPLFIAHGRDSQQYPIERACDELRLFHVAGMSVTLRQYPCGDQLHRQMLHDTDVWIMEQVTGIPASDPSDNHDPPWPQPLN